MELTLNDGALHAPYFIFVRGPSSYSDEDLLKQFGIGHFQLIANPTRNHLNVVLADAGEWKLVADSWLYHLWNRPDRMHRLEELAKSNEVFAFSVGDCDLSYDFCHYANGALVRRFVVESPGYSDQVVVENFGPNMIGEPSPAAGEAVKISELLNIGESLGAITRFSRDEFRIYGAPGD